MNVSSGALLPPRWRWIANNQNILVQVQLRSRGATGTPQLNAFHFVTSLLGNVGQQFCSADGDAEVRHLVADHVSTSRAGPQVGPQAGQVAEHAAKVQESDAVVKPLKARGFGKFQPLLLDCLGNLNDRRDVFDKVRVTVLNKDIPGVAAKQILFEPPQILPGLHEAEQNAFQPGAARVILLIGIRRGSDDNANRRSAVECGQNAGIVLEDHGWWKRSWLFLPHLP